MTTTSIRDDKLIFADPESMKSDVEYRLKRRYGRGIFVQDSFVAPDNTVSVKLGISYPMDVSDRRERDNVTKFINIDNVYTLSAEPTGSGYYNTELPDRSEIREEFDERKNQIIERMDWTMAKNIFADVYQLDPVKNQLSSLAQIVRWLRESPEIPVDRLDRIQRTNNTRQYLQVLHDLDYVNLTDDNKVRPGRKLEVAEEMASEEGLSLEEYQQAVIGNIVADGYYILRDQLDLRMLSHFPKYANAYYYSAVQRDKPDLWLAKEDLQKNLRQEWGDDVDEFILNDKLRKLEEVDVIRQEDGLVTGNSEIYAGITQAQNAVNPAD